MKCDQCEAEATVHELRVVNGKKVERHLCERCARKQGIAVQPTASVPELIEHYMQQAAAAAKAKPADPPPPARATQCPTCGTGYLEFRQTGLLGCPDCYRVFEAQLSPLLERAHEGGTHHVGKLPRRQLAGGPKPQGRITQGPNPEPAGAEAVLGGPSQRAGRIAALRKQLDEAVRTEQYERAASLRDELRRLAELEIRPGAGEPGQRSD